MDNKNIWDEVKFFITEYIFYSLVCLLGIVASLYYYKEFVIMLILVLPGSIIYFIIFIVKLMKIYIDIRNLDIVNNIFHKVIFVKRKSDILITKEYYEVEAIDCYNCINQNEYLKSKHSLSLQNDKNINVTINYLKRSKIIINMDIGQNIRIKK